MINKLARLLIITLFYGCQQVENVPDASLSYAWSGAPTDSSIVISFKTSGPDESRVILYSDPERQEVVDSTDLIKTEKEDYFANAVALTGLESNKQYYYEVASTSERSQGTFQTFPAGPSSFNFAFGSCARTGSDNRVFTSINKEDPLFYMNIGDFHYENIKTNCAHNFAEAYFDIMRSQPQRNLYQEHPFIYIWDDHDYGPNNSAADSPCKEEALEAFRRFIPHYPLQLGEDGPVSQSFDVGRVKFVLTDLRSHKIRPKYEGCVRIENGTNFGTSDHINWFFEELLSAKEEGKIVAWVNPIPWISSPESPKWECDENDDWGGFPEERQLIANFIQDNKIPLFMLSGDAHMLAIDDGSNTDFASENPLPVPLFHAAPLDNVGIVKGGPYSHGYSIKRGQYGLVEINDNGTGEICVTFKGMDSSGKPARNVEGQILEYTFCRKTQI